MPTPLSLPLQTEKNRRRRYFFDRQTGQVYAALSDIGRSKEIDEEALAYFLQIGFVPGDRTLFKDIDCLPGGCEIVADGEKGWRVGRRECYAEILDRERYAGMDWTGLLKAGKEAFLRAMENCWERKAGRDIVVPLSGGIDSRGILAALLEFTSPGNIQTYTFGTPGTWDYEIGNQVAGWAGTKHRSFDLSRTSITEEKLYQAAHITDSNTDLFQPLFSLDILDYYGTAPVYWSGFAGDTVGGNLYSNEAEGKSEKSPYITDTKYFINKHQYHNYDLEVKDLNLELLQVKHIYKGVVSARELLFYPHRLERYVNHQIIFNGIEQVFPYLKTPFLRYIWSVPPSFRAGKKLFDATMAEAFRDAFDLPVKKNFGFPLRSPRLKVYLNKLYFVGRHRLWQYFPSYQWKNPMVNYVDYDQALREQAELISITKAAIHRLKNRKKTDLNLLTIDKVIEDHELFRRNNGKILTQLASLEYILQANNTA